MKLVSCITAAAAVALLLVCAGCGEEGGDDLKKKFMSGKFNQEESLAALESDSEYRRSVAAEYLPKLGDKKVIKPLVRHMHTDPSIMIRKICVTGLMQRQKEEAEPLVPEFIKVLEQKDANLRQKAVTALGKVRTEEGYKALLGMLKDPAPEVRVETIKSLALFEKKETLPELAKLYEDKESSVRREAVDTIARVGGKGAADLLILALKCSDFVVKRKAVEELGRHKARKAAPDIIPLLDADDYSLREVTARALGLMRSREAGEALRQRYKVETSLDVKRAIVAALSNIGGIETVDFMIGILDEGDIPKRLDALEALKKLKVDSVALREKLKELIAHDASTKVRKIAKELLQKLGD
jgi:HEAT repeat protein